MTFAGVCKFPVVTSNVFFRVFCRPRGMQNSFRPFSHQLHTISQEAMLDGRARLSRIWLPTGGIAPDIQEDSHAKLLRAGFLRQAYPGVFHLLPLGRRVLEKLESLIDRHMYKLGASKVELSSISSEDIWSRSGRLASGNQELFRFQDRRATPYLLSPTHEEEITNLVSSTVKSYKQLPILLYQTSRKYRDELRPRHGLLRSREFVMKDLYTFDINSETALSTYYRVRDAYVMLFEELKLPFLVAEANSGDIGGTLSHEFHFPTSKGEDRVVNCSTCSYTANEELAESPIRASLASASPSEMAVSVDTGNVATNGKAKLNVWRGISKDRCEYFNIWYSDPTKVTAEINIHAVKSLLPQLDTTIENPTKFWATPDVGVAESIKIVNVIDGRLSPSMVDDIQTRKSWIPYHPTLSHIPKEIPMANISSDPVTGSKINLLRIETGDACPRCSEGVLNVQKAIELGHTFHLGSRYSEPMAAVVSVPKHLVANDLCASKQSVRGDTTEQLVPYQMGCHGIGVSRIIGAVADTLADESGLNWPRIMAPFEAVIIPAKGLDAAALEVYDILSTPSDTASPQLNDVILDDRELTFPWKVQDADLVGYPTIIVVGRKWKSERKCEVQCRRLGIRMDVDVTDLRSFVASLLMRL